LRTREGKKEKRRLGGKKICSSKSFSLNWNTVCRGNKLLKRVLMGEEEEREEKDLTVSPSRQNL